jgi:hypothetical protein
VTISTAGEPGVGVARANPRAVITAEVLAETRASPDDDGRALAALRVQHRDADLRPGDPARGVGRARRGGRHADPDAPTFGWLDLGWKIDTTALGVLAWESKTRRVIAGVKVLEPPVDERAIVRCLLDRQERYGPVGWVYDPNAGGRQMAQQLEAGDHPLQLERGAPADRVHRALAGQRADGAGRDAPRRGDPRGWIVHDGDPALRRHALNAVKREPRRREVEVRPAGGREGRAPREVPDRRAHGGAHGAQ